jgi:hypothetical protein
MTVGAAWQIINKKDPTEPVDYYTEFDHPEEVSDLILSIINSENRYR